MTRPKKTEMVKVIERALRGTYPEASVVIGTGGLTISFEIGTPNEAGFTIVVNDTAALRRAVTQQKK